MIESTLIDNGTLDTCIECRCTECGNVWEECIDGEYAADYRADDGTMIDLDGLADSLCIECPECEG